MLRWICKLNQKTPQKQKQKTTKQKPQNKKKNTLGTA